MKRADIEARIVTLQNMHAAETNASTLATLNRCIERLIMMDAEDDLLCESLETSRVMTD